MNRDRGYVGKITEVWEEGSKNWGEKKEMA
jgi:hypothetical protein